MKNGKVCCILGHQPSNLPFECSDKELRCVQMKKTLEEEIKKLILDNVLHFMCPMNIGAELYAAEIIEQLQREGYPITLTAVLPYETQAEDWSENERDRFFEIMRYCSQEKHTSSHYDDACIAKNIDFMLGVSDYLLVVWNGKPGNIEYAVLRAGQKNIPVINIDPNTI